MVVLVIGANCTGKTHFIARNFSGEEYTVLNIYDYQERMDQEAKGLTMWERLYRANELLNEDVAALVRQGKNAVVEQTFLRALRRIACVDAIRAVSPDVPVEVYAMTPTDEQLRHNCEERIKESSGNAEAWFQHIKHEMEEVWEFPNPAEGYAKIYAVSGDAITECADTPDESIIEQARSELAREKEKRRSEQESRKRHEELVRRTGTERFWHICEACGKKELLTTDEAFEQGWDYPPRMYAFRMLSPRTCGNCLITSTLHWRLLTGETSLRSLDEHDKETIERILNEPESVMPTES